MIRTSPSGFPFLVLAMILLAFVAVLDLLSFWGLRGSVDILNLWSLQFAALIQLFLSIRL